MFALRNSVKRICRIQGCLSGSMPLKAASAAYATEAQPAPSGKIENIATSIASLNLLEVAELTDLLKKRLNLPDAPAFDFGAAAAVAGAAASPKAEAGEEEEKPAQITYTVKLVKFDEKQKVALIKEIKNIMEGMNLVQAKKFVDTVPAVVKADISKSEAEKLKEVLTKVGAEIELAS